MAEIEGLTVVHYDADFDRISEVTGQPSQWMVVAGTVSYRGQHGGQLTVEERRAQAVWERHVSILTEAGVDDRSADVAKASNRELRHVQLRQGWPPISVFLGMNSAQCYGFTVHPHGTRR